MCGSHFETDARPHLHLPVGRARRPARRLHRRAFLGDFGRGVTALALLGPVATACGGSDPVAGSDGTTTVPGDVDPGATTGSTAGDTPSDSTGGTEGTWSRSVLGNVSAYVLVRGGQAAIVDTGNPGSAEAIGQTITDLGLTYADVGHVILTHYHGDHAGSIAEVLDSAANATGYIGEADADRVQADLTTVTEGTDIFGLQVIATPGHTVGHISLWDEQTGVLVAGDAMNGVDGGVGGANPQFTPDMEQANDSIRKMASLIFDTVYFGHGEPVIGGAGSAVQDLATQL